MSHTGFVHPIIRSSWSLLIPPSPTPQHHRLSVQESPIIPMACHRNDPAMPVQADLKVLRVINSFDGGGTDNSVLEFLDHHDPSQIRVDVLCAGGIKGRYADLVPASSEILVARKRVSPWSFARDVAKAIGGRDYDVIFSHMDYMGAGVLEGGRLAGIPVRIAGFHSTLPNTGLRYAGYPGGAWLRIRYLERLRVAVDKAATAFFAVGHVVAEKAVESVFDLRGRPTDVILRGFDLERYRPLAQDERAAIREELGFEREAIVLGHTGAFKLEKNHTLLVEIAAVLRREGLPVHLLLCGEGYLRQEVLQQCAERDVPVLAPGVVEGITRYYNAMDAFVLPSSREGLSGSLIEAQACGIPVIVSDLPENREALAPVYRDLMFQPDGAGVATAVSAFRRWLSWSAGHRASAIQDGLAYVSRFDIENHTRAMYEYWARLVCSEESTQDVD